MNKKKPAQRFRKKGRGKFKPGPDSRRHIFTQEERRKGFEKTFRKLMFDEPTKLRWFKKLIKGYYRGQTEKEKRS